MDRAELVAFVRRRRHARVATCGPDGTLQAALIDIAVTDRAEIIFDTPVDSPRYRNILAFPQVALVIGEHEVVSIQSEGIADILTGDDRDRCLRVYFQQYPQARERALNPGITHVRVTPRWIRLNDVRPESYGIQEIPLDT